MKLQISTIFLIFYSFGFAQSQNRDISFDFNNREAFIKGAFEDAPIYPGGIITNNGLEMIVSIDLLVTVNGSTSVYPISGLDLGQNERALIKVPEPILMGTENLDIEVAISNANGMGDDDDLSNDVGTLYTVEHVIPYPGKGVLAEEFTGTWCLNCPFGTVITEIMYQRYPGAFVGVAVHNTDPMVDEIYNEGMLDFGVQFLPSMILNRGEIVTPDQLEQTFLTSITELPKAALDNEADFDEGTRSLTISLNANFQADIPDGYKFNALILEDHVTGSGAQYQQVNEFAGGIEMDIFSILSDPVPSDMIEYNHVARELLEGFDGTTDGLESSFSEGESASVVFDTYTIPANYDVENIYIVGIITNELGEVDNTRIVSLTEAINNGSTTNTKAVMAEELIFNFSPNPFKNTVKINIDQERLKDAKLQVFDIFGNQVWAQSVSILDKSIEFDGSILDVGSYIFRISNASNSLMRRAIKIN